MNFFSNLFDIKNEFNYSVTGLNKELNMIYLYDCFNKFNKNILVVVNSLYDANDIYNRLLNYTDNVLFFPMDDFIASEASSISPELKIDRLITLNSLLDSDKKYIVVTNLMGYIRYLPLIDKYKNSIIELKSEVEIDRDSIINKLFNIGYEKVSSVTKTGEYAVRGYVIDIFPINYEKPIRIEFWGDVIDGIKYFDVDSQISNSNVDSVKIYPFTEFLLDSNINILEENKKQKYLFNYSSVCSISNYLGDFISVFYDYNQILSSYTYLRNTITDYDKEVNPPIKTNYMFNFDDISNKDNIYLMEFDNLLDLNINNNKYLSFNIDNYMGNFEVIKNSIISYLKSNKTVIICIKDKSIVKRIVTYLEMDEYIIYTDENNIVNNKLNIVNKIISSGFIYEDYVVMSSNDLFGKKEIKKISNKYKVGMKINTLNNLEKGDLIVHIDHGIGKYVEIATLTKNGIKKDYIKLIYADGDMLYLPVEKIDKITKYNGKEGAFLKLDKLGSDNWNKKKARVRKKLESIASDLIEVSVARESMKGYAFSKDDENQILFDSKFKYTPTSDQITAIEIIKEAMESDKPMDMLLCGDVGYGKTEVAFRAIFKAVNDGKQACYLCPTTILSSQQYSSAMERFSDFPVNIALLNRFTTVKEQNIILAKLIEGKIDILFGTHKLLNDLVKFKDLGLLVIDEEQRFGVVHKEKLKKYKNSIDVLTLSATPIPRTLEMSMAGVRGLALIETPPEKRRSIQTYVLPENNNIIKDAIYKELSRNGQVFILYNSVDGLDKKLNDVLKLVPEASVRYAHGRMDKIQLENVMNDFINREFDILVCTTIIETGIDIPNVNTLIILDADHFGLSQLYQLRGRIGRSDRIGYAYFMYNNKKQLTDLAVKRLNTIKEFTSLGSGFKIAMRDLSIRGAGDILGVEQSGFIDSIGIDLYLKMLKEEVDKLKGKEVKEEVIENNKPLIDVDTHIDDKYVPDDEIKIEIHKLINSVNSNEDIEKLKDTLDNRFGIVTEELIIYMHEELLEKQAKALNITNTRQDKNSIEIVLPEEVVDKLDGEKLFYTIYDISKYFKLSYRNKKIYINLNITKLDKHFIYYLNSLLEEIIKMINNK